MPKPGSVPTFATDANYNDPGKPWDGKPTVVEPTAGQKASGYKPKQKPPAQHWNWFKNLTGQWLSWLNGLFDDADNMNLPGNLVTGGHVTLGADKHVTVSGGGLHKRGTFRRFYPAPYAFVKDGAPTMATNGAAWTCTALDDRFLIPIVLYKFERIVNYYAIVRCGAGDQFSSAIRYQFGSGGGGTGEGGTAGATSAGTSGVIEVFGETGVNLQHTFDEVTLSGQYAYNVGVRCSAFATSPAFFGLLVDIDIP